MGVEKHILCTRELGGEKIAFARTLGLQIDAVPFIQTRPLPSERFSDLLPDQEGMQVILTSPRAVQTLAEAGYEGRGWQVWCLSGATRELVLKHFPKATIAGMAGDARGLTPLISVAVGQRLYFACGNHRRDELPQRLTERGLRLEEVVVYETLLSPVKLNKVYDAILFFSPSAVHSFLLENRIEPGTVLFALGQTTGETLKEFLNPVVIAPEPDALSLINEVARYFSLHGHEI